MNLKEIFSEVFKHNPEPRKSLNTTEENPDVFKHLRLLPPQERVFGALRNPNWDYWTYDGLSFVSGLSEEYVKEIIKTYPGVIRQVGFCDSQDRELFTLSSKPVTFRERVASFLYLLSKNASPTTRDLLK